MTDSEPRECLCEGYRKTLTTDAGTWHICERCSNGYFLRYDAAPGEPVKAAKPVACDHKFHEHISRQVMSPVKCKTCGQAIDAAQEDKP